MKHPKIKFPLDKEEKAKMHKRLDEVLNQKDGKQVIILIDKNTITDYYQNECLTMVLKQIKESAEEYAELTRNVLLNNHK